MIRNHASKNFYVQNDTHDKTHFFDSNKFVLNHCRYKESKHMSKMYQKYEKSVEFVIFTALKYI